MTEREHQALIARASMALARHYNNLAHEMQVAAADLLKAHKPDDRYPIVSTDQIVGAIERGKILRYLLDEMPAGK